MSNTGQLAAWQSRILRKMNDETYILKVEKDSHDGLIVMFSDGTTAGYVVEELLSLRPLRELTHKPGERKPPPNPLNAGVNLGRLVMETIPYSEVSRNGSGRGLKPVSS